MRLWSALITRLILLNSLSTLSTLGVWTIAGPAAAQVSDIKPPVAARRPVTLKWHGIERTDNYGWLRDTNWRQVMEEPTRLSREINEHIVAENAYAEAMLAPLAPMRAELIAEMKGRIVQDDSG